MIPPNTGRLRGQIAIVTGGSSGIGRATCMALAREGAFVVVVGQTPARMTGTVAELERVLGAGGSLGLVLDVRLEADMEEMARQTIARFGRVDIMIACAGVGGGKHSGRLLPYPVAQMPTQEWDEVVDTNLKGVFLSNRAVLPAMISQRSGSIINISSARGGRHGSPYAAAYCASKFGVVGFSESLAEEVRPFGIKVQVVLPDATDTPILGGGEAASLFGRTLPPARVGDFIVHLLSLPEDTILLHSIIAPFGNQTGPAQRWQSPV
jgi:NAD(P)-dependent dehydrogenase (short-subunit alcohol dehydrogenase family)